MHKRIWIVRGLMVLVAAAACGQVATLIAAGVCDQMAGLIAGSLRNLDLAGR